MNRPRRPALSSARRVDTRVDAELPTAWTAFANRARHEVTLEGWPKDGQERHLGAIQGPSERAPDLVVLLEGREREGAAKRGRGTGGRGRGPARSRSRDPRTARRELDG